MFGLKNTVSCAALIISITLSTLSNAQQFQPITTYYKNNAMYIFGGIPTGSTTLNNIQQSFMLDFSTSWNTSKPIYKTLPNGPANTTTGTLSGDEQSIFTIADKTGYIYNLNTTQWNSIISNINVNPFEGLFSVTDPKTGIIYIPNGYQNITSRSMLAVNLTAGTTNNIPMHPNLQPSQYYSVSWSKALQSMIVTGGTVPGLYAYNPTRGWRDLSSLVVGDIPPPRFGSCLVPVNEGSKMILFGGVDPSGNYSLNDIYTLDTPTMIWTRGPNINSSNGRGFAACSVSQGSLIVWGGGHVVNNTSNAPRDAVVIFNVTKAAWITTYTVPVSPPTETPTEAPTTNSRESVSHLSAILGVFFGLLIVAIKVSGFMFYRSRRAKKIQLAKSNRNSYRDSYCFNNNNSNNSNNPNNSNNSSNFIMHNNSTMNTKFNDPKDKNAVYLMSNNSTAIDLSAIPANSKEEFYSDLQNVTSAPKTPEVPHHSRPSLTLSKILSPLSPGPTLASMPRPIPARYTPEPVATWATTYSPENLVRQDSATTLQENPFVYRQYSHSPPSSSGSCSSLSIKDSYSRNTTPSNELEDDRQYPREEYRLPPIQQGSNNVRDPRDCYNTRSGQIL
ncbi:hypothetical protein BGZ76_001668 [Entomortierella beljakovae]|nr:hypothetical protein BGZ76_001668 [Entomortierella beljakovae]